ncbi:MAG: THUMP domain-containing protein [Nanoarchaeota archaeon]
MFNLILLRYGELFLKGRNRSGFEQKLIGNIKKKIPSIKIQKTRNRLIIPYFPEHRNLTRIFGLVSYSPAVRVEKEINAVKDAAVRVTEFAAQSRKEAHGCGKETEKITFRVETKRSDKTFPVTSPEMNMNVGKFIEKRTSFQFSFGHPNIILGIEINEQGAYIYFETFPCFGGLPVGVEGRALLLVENKASILAGLLFMKRGGQVFPLSFAEKDISLLQEFSPIKLKLKKISDFKECASFARENNIDVLVSGQNFESLSGYDAGILILRPLISYPEEKISGQIAKFSCTACTWNCF